MEFDMKTEEDEAFDDLARKQGDWGGGYQAKKAMAIDKQKEPMTEEKKPHIFVATPMYGGMCCGYFTNSLIAMTNVMKQCGWDMSFSSMFNESLIQRGRNALVHQFLITPCTHLMFIDADIKFDPAHIPPLVHADVDIICGIYPKKEINWHGVEKAVKEGVDVGKLATRTGSLVVNLVDYTGSVTVP